MVDFSRAVLAARPCVDPWALAEQVQGGDPESVRGMGIRFRNAWGVAVEAAGWGASSANAGAGLSRQLRAEQVADGHAFQKHVITQGEFPGIRTRSEFSEMVENVLADGKSKLLANGREGF